MFNLLKRLFGAGHPTPLGAAPADSVEYKGYRIRPEPYRVDGQFQTAGIIEHDAEDGVKEHRFVRAEKHASRDDAVTFAVFKGKQIIDEQGPRLFGDGR